MTQYCNLFKIRQTSVSLSAITYYPTECLPAERMRRQAPQHLLLIGTDASLLPGGPDRTIPSCLSCPRALRGSDMGTTAASLCPRGLGLSEAEKPLQFSGRTPVFCFVSHRSAPSFLQSPLPYPGVSTCLRWHVSAQGS